MKIMSSLLVLLFSTILFTSCEVTYNDPLMLNFDVVSGESHFYYQEAEVVAPWANQELACRVVIAMRNGDIITTDSEDFALTYTNYLGQADFSFDYNLYSYDYPVVYEDISAVVVQFVGTLVNGNVYVASRAQSVDDYYTELAAEFLGMDVNSGSAEKDILIVLKEDVVLKKLVVSDESSRSVVGSRAIGVGLSTLNQLAAQAASEL